MTNEKIDAIAAALKGPFTKGPKGAWMEAVSFARRMMGITDPQGPFKSDEIAEYWLVNAVYLSLVTGKEQVCAECADCGKCAPQRVRLQQPLAEEFRKRGILITFGDQGYKGVRSETCGMDLWSIKLKAEIAQPAPVQ